MPTSRSPASTTRRSPSTTTPRAPRTRSWRSPRRPCSPTTPTPTAERLTLTSVGTPTGGTVAIVGDDVEFTPTADLCGDNVASFIYGITDGNDTDTAVVTIDLACVDDAPVAVERHRAPSPRTRAPPRSTCWPTTPTPTAARRRSPRSPSRPTAPSSITGGGTGLTYKPERQLLQRRRPHRHFTYTLNGGSTATVAVTVTCVDDAPIAVERHRDRRRGRGRHRDRRARQRHRHRRRPEDDHLGHPAGQRHRRRSPAAAPGSPTRRTPNYCNDRHAHRHVHLHPERRLRRPPSRSPSPASTTPRSRSTTPRPSPRTPAPPRSTCSANDTDLDGGPKTITSVTQPANGTVAITGGGTGLTYPPNAELLQRRRPTTLHLHPATAAPPPRPSTVTSPASTTHPTAVDDAATVAEDAGATDDQTCSPTTPTPTATTLTITAVTQPGQRHRVARRRRHRSPTPRTPNYCETGVSASTYTSPTR